uniref:CSON014385 protein n=1 Tax=Culicoides sonorensis TaxID=179676 RepID=A0A336KS91_CULSO
MLKLLAGVLLCLGSSYAQSPFGIYTFKCSAAMVCVDLIDCDQSGMISKNANSLTEEQAVFRFNPCKKPDGNRGVCCRDPEYKDDWPTGPKPPGPGTIGDDYCPPPLVKLPNKSCGCNSPQIVLPDGTCGTARTGSSGCPSRNRTAMLDLVYKPYDSSDFEAGAGEFPWQGAVFTSDNEFLCGCYITRNSTCTTTASCVEDYEPSELKVVVGVYNIANLKAVADKPPQSSVVKHIAFDPKYSSSSEKYDIAILHLKNRVKYNNYTQAICLDNLYAIPFESYDDCVVTGWGNADTAHYVDVELLSAAECKKSVPGFDIKTMACAKPNHEVCRLAEFGGGLHCRETGKRNKPSTDVYLLKGTYSAVTSCDSSQVITFSRINFDWFQEALYNPLKYPLRGVLLCVGPSYGQSPFGIYKNIYFKCSAAMVCVDLIDCNKSRMIAKNVNSVTEEEAVFLFNACKKPDGARGVCCQDPNYKDDWPTVPGTCDPPNVRLDDGRCVTPPTPPPGSCPPPLIKLPNGSCGCKPPKVLLPSGECGEGTTTTTTTKGPSRTPSKRTKKKTKRSKTKSNQKTNSNGCPKRNRKEPIVFGNIQSVSSDFEAAFNEFPWQGAVFRSNGTFLCGCSVTENSTCTTTASCVKGYKPSDLTVVVGVYNISNFEPVKDKSIQSSVVKSIASDPKYSSSTGKYDIATLHLEKKITLNTYIQSICLDNYYAVEVEDNDDCLVTGWGNASTLRYVDFELLSGDECKESVPGFDIEAMACAQPDQEVCRLAKFGGGLYCRETGERDKPSTDVYLLKGTYSGVTSCDSSPVMTFSIIDAKRLKEY